MDSRIPVTRMEVGVEVSYILWGEGSGGGSCSTWRVSAEGFGSGME